jgi:hypothetical protein
LTAANELVIIATGAGSLLASTYTTTAQAATTWVAPTHHLPVARNSSAPIAREDEAGPEERRQALGNERRRTPKDSRRLTGPA